MIVTVNQTSLAHQTGGWLDVTTPSAPSNRYMKSADVLPKSKPSASPLPSNDLIIETTAARAISGARCGTCMLIVSKLV